MPMLLIQTAARWCSRSKCFRPLVLGDLEPWCDLRLSSVKVLARSARTFFIFPICVMLKTSAYVPQSIDCGRRTEKHFLSFPYGGVPPDISFWCDCSKIKLQKRVFRRREKRGQEGQFSVQKDGERQIIGATVSRPPCIQMLMKTNAGSTTIIPIMLIQTTARWCSRPKRFVKTSRCGLF